MHLQAYKLYWLWLVDFGALVACQHYLQKNYRQLPRHLLIRTQVISTIHLLTSYHFAMFVDIFNDDEPGDISTELFLYKLIY